MSLDESVLAHTVIATLQSINSNGGVLGHPIEPVVVDPASNWPVTLERASALHEQGINPIFGLAVPVGNFDGAKVERVLAEQSFAAPSGFVVKFDPQTRDLYRPLFIGEIQADARVKLVHTSGKALAP